MPPPPHIGWLANTGETLTTSDGKSVEVWALQHQDDPATLSAWATHFRNHYCKDLDLPALVEGTGLSNSDFLTMIKFPDAATSPGPSTRSGDFGEILVADFIEYIGGYWCPREGRYEDRVNRNVATNGSDVIGFRFAEAIAGSPQDELFVLESKASLTRVTGNRLQDAVDHSVKDSIRRAMSLNAIKQRLLKTDRQQALLVQRFRDENDKPYVEISGAVAVLEHAVFDQTPVHEVDTSQHPNQENLRLFIITGESMMSLVHALYTRAANEA